MKNTDGNTFDVAAARKILKTLPPDDAQKYLAHLPFQHRADIMAEEMVDNLNANVKKDQAS